MPGPGKQEANGTGVIGRRPWLARAGDGISSKKLAGWRLSRQRMCIGPGRRDRG